MAAAVGMVSRSTRTRPCWDDDVDARNAEASEKLKSPLLKPFAPFLACEE